jgi:hypothetical protein
VRIRAKVSLVMVLEFPRGIRIPSAMAEKMGAAFEAGFRTGMRKDIEMSQSVYRQMFGLQADARLEDMHFDVSYEDVEGAGLGKSGVTS